MNREELKVRVDAFWAAAAAWSEADLAEVAANQRLRKAELAGVEGAELAEAEAAYLAANDRLGAAFNVERAAIEAISADGQTVVVRQPTGRVTIFQNRRWSKVDEYFDLSPPPPPPPQPGEGG